MANLLQSLGKTVKFWAGADAGSKESGYDLVSSRGDGRRRASTVEIKHEDEILTAQKRLQMINLMRDGMRNAPQIRAIMQQLRVLIVGMEGGKLTVTTENDTWNDAAQKAFGVVSRSIDFVDGSSLNEALKLIIATLAGEGGDFAAIFDDGVLTGGTGSGKVRFFESDNIANLEPAEFEKRFGTGWTQSQGLIYNQYGRFSGIVVSSLKRGKTSFAATECFTLKRDPDAPLFDSPWFYGKRKWRLLQGRGISPHSAAIAALIDMYELVQSEVDCAKLNGKLFAQVIDTLGTADGSDGSEIVPDSGATDAQITAQVQEETEETEVSLDVTEFEANAGAKTLNMPFGYKMDLLDTKRPNNNVIDFVEWLNGNAAAVHGLGRVYSGLKAETSYTAFRGEQTITFASIEEAQKELERGFLDWFAVRAIRWLISVGLLDEGPEGWEDQLTWSWPSMKEVNEVDAQSAVSAKIRNMVTTYRALLGPKWQQILTQVADEIKFCAENGMIHPATQTVSGSVVGVDIDQKTKKGNDNDDESK